MLPNLFTKALTLKEALEKEPENLPFRDELLAIAANILRLIGAAAGARKGEPHAD